MSINFSIQRMGPYGSTEPEGKWIAANRVRNTGYDMRFWFPVGWTFVDYRVFQIFPNERKTDAVTLGIKDITHPVLADPPQPPFRPRDGENEITVVTDYPATPTSADDNAITTKRQIMSMHWEKPLDSIEAGWLDLYTEWPDPEPDTSRDNPVRYHNPNDPRDSTFEIWGARNSNPITIRNWQNRGYLLGGIAPIFDIILRFEDEAGVFVLVDPPVRNER